MDRKSLAWPWITALIACICLAVSSVVITVIRIQDSVVQPEPDYVRQQFDKLFAEPDWEALYAMSSNERSSFESGAVVEAYMERMVGDKPLQLYEEPSANDAYRVFSVFCAERLVASFSLYKSDMSINYVLLHLDGKETAFVSVPADVTVSVNGVLLDDAFLVYSIHTKAEDYLPDGVHGVQLKGYIVNGLLMPPDVTAVDRNGNAVTLLYDDVTNVYYTEYETPAQISDQQLQFVTCAATADARHIIGDISNKDLAEFFDTKSDLYKMVSGNPRIHQKYQTTWVEDVNVGEFCRYSETLFSANVKLTQRIVRLNDTIKTYYMDKTYLVELQQNGEYRVIAYTNEHLTEPVQNVKLVFVMPDGETFSQMVDIGSTHISGPDLSGYHDFMGWATQTAGEDLSTVSTVRILPDGTVLGGLENMVLHPIFSKSIDKGGEMK